MRLILLGPPGAGKGTQAAYIAKAHRIAHLSTGDLLRAAVAQGTDLGREAKGYMDRGELVPDSLVLAVVVERLKEADEAGGFLLDGFPRNVSQAQALSAELGDVQIECVVHLRLEDDEIVRRLLARGRKDDTEAVIRRRLEVYRAETSPLVDHYRERGILQPVDAQGTIEEIQARVEAVLQSCQAAERGAS